MTQLWKICREREYGSETVGVYSSEENADIVLQYVAEDCYPVHIEVFELDAGVENLKQGKKCYYFEFLDQSQVPCYSFLCKSIPLYQEHHSEDTDYYFVWADDEESAKQIATERPVQYLNNKGISNE